MIFVDDAVVLCGVSNFHESVEAIQRFVSILFDWLNTNKLIAHENETKLILFTLRIRPVLPDIRNNYNSLEWFRILSTLE